MTTSPKESKTKEQILGEGGDACEYNWELHVIPYDTALGAMEQYARSTAIEFVDWTNSEDCNYKWGSDGWYHWAESYQDGYKPISTTQLYELFSHSIDK